MEVLEIPVTWLLLSFEWISWFWKWILTPANFLAVARMVCSLFRIQGLNIPNGTWCVRPYPADLHNCTRGTERVWSVTSSAHRLLLVSTLYKFPILPNWAWLPDFSWWIVAWKREILNKTQRFLLLFICHFSLWFRKVYFSQPGFGRKDYIVRLFSSL